MEIFCLPKSVFGQGEYEALSLSWTVRLTLMSHARLFSCEGDGETLTSMDECINFYGSRLSMSY